MFKRLRSILGHREEIADPLVKVAGMPTRRDADTCLEALEAKGIGSVLKEDSQNAGTFEVWVQASQEPEARLLMGLSGHSVIRLERPAPDRDEGGNRGPRRKPA